MGEFCGTSFLSFITPRYVTTDILLKMCGLFLDEFRI